MKSKFVALVFASAVLAGCGGSNSTAPTTIAAQSKHIPTAAQLAIRATLPSGTRIFYVGNVVIADGSKQTVLSSSATISRTSSGYTAVDGGKTYTFSPAAKISTEGGDEYYARPGSSVPASLKNVQPSEVVGGAQTGAVPLSCFDQQAVGRSVTGGRAIQSDCDNNDNGGAPMTVDSQNGVVTSFECDGTQFTVNFDNNIGNSANYNYSYSLTDANGAKVYQSSGTEGSVVGNGGAIYVTTPYSYASISFSLTMTNGGMADTGNAHAHYGGH